jgi:hypothetical protein
MTPFLRRKAVQFVIAVALWLVSSLVALNTPDGSWVWDFTPLVILLMLTPMAAFACAILYLFELGEALRASKTRRRLLGIALGLLQFLSGLLCLAVGLAIILWVFYVIFVKRLPEYLGGIQTPGLAPLLLLTLLFTPTRKFLLSLFFKTLGQPLMYAQYGYARMIGAFRPPPPEEAPSLEAADKDKPS